jgi:surfeit locus 1 family protein
MSSVQWRFRPRLGPSIAVLSMVLLLVGLGTWQIQRMAWKEALIAELTARNSQPPGPLPLDIPDARALEFTPVRLRGEFLHDRELFIGARVYKGEAGLHVITPFVLTDGRTVLVDRGWVPNNRRAPETRAAGQVAGIVTVEGQVRTGGWKGYEMFRPANDPEKNVWLWMDLPVMAARTGVNDSLTSLYIAAGASENPGGLPIGGASRLEVSNNHFGYALTWFTLAIALLVIYVMHQSRPQERDDG